MKFAMIIGMMSLSAFAAVPQYNVKMNVMVQGQKHSSPNFIVKAGETATVFEKHGNEENFVEVEAVPARNNSIRMNMVIGRIGPNGERIILSQPQMITAQNKEATVTQGDMDGESFSMSVIAKEKKAE